LKIQDYAKKDEPTTADETLNLLKAFYHENEKRGIRV
jgi:hypothetical protein